MGTIWPPNLSHITGPKYTALVDALRDAIDQKELNPGDKLPPVRDLAWKINVTPGTVARAYRSATEHGLLEATVGRGTFVADTKKPKPLQEHQEIFIETIENEMDLRVARTPNFGQDTAIHAILKNLSENYINHPSEVDEIKGRKAIMEWLQYSEIDPQLDDIALSYGAQNAVIVALHSILTGPDPIIVTDELVFPGMRHAARSLRAQLIGVERDQNGISIPALEHICRTKHPQVLLTSTNIHNPTTFTTSLERRLEIAEIARKYDLHIIDDDAYGICKPDLPPLKTILPERVWYVGSLSKSVAAGVRFGYLVTPSGRGPLARAALHSTNYGISKILIDLCSALITNGAAEEFRQKTIEFNQRRVRMAVNKLGQWDIRWNPCAPFIWLHMPTGWRGSAFARECERSGVLLRPADEFALTDGKAPNAVRLVAGPQLSDEAFNKSLDIITRLLNAPPTTTVI